MLEQTHYVSRPPRYVPFAKKRKLYNVFSTASGALGVVPFSDIHIYPPEIGLSVLNCSTEKGESVSASPAQPSPKWPKIKNEQKSKMTKNQKWPNNQKWLKIKKHCQRHNGPRNWLRNFDWTWQHHGTTCINCKFGHQIAPLALVANMATRWRHLQWLQI